MPFTTQSVIVQVDPKTIELIHEHVHINTIHVALQVSSIMGPIPQGFGAGMAGCAFARLSVSGVRCRRDMSMPR